MSKNTSLQEQTRQAFLKAIEENPNDASPRLIFADWLEERGESEEAAEQRRLVDTVEGEEAIELFLAEQPEGSANRVWSYSPNGGYGGPAGQTDYYSDEALRDLLEGWEEDDERSITYSRSEKELKLSCCPPRGVHQYYQIWSEKSPLLGRDIVAYHGAHSGFDWQDSFQEEEFCTDTLQELLFYCDTEEAEAAIGVETIEDCEYGDDGNFWLVTDAARFQRVAELCRRADRASGRINYGFGNDQMELARLIGDKLCKEAGFSY